MGRLATEVAGRATYADNIPEYLPRTSLLDALLPRSLASPQPLGPTSSLYCGDTEVRRNHKGKLVFVRPKGYGSSSLYAPEDVGERRVTYEDVKKNKAGKGGGEQKGGKGQTDEKKANGEKNEGEFTAEEDAKLTELKTGKENKSWAQIMEEMGRPKHELQKRWKELEAAAKEGGGGDDDKADDKKNEKEGGGGDDDKADDKKNENEGGKGKKNKGKPQQGGGGDGEKKDGNVQKGGGGGGEGDAGKKKGGAAKEWTAEDDVKLKELYAADTEWRMIAKELQRPQADIKAHWEQIKGSVGKTEEEEKPKNPSGKKGKKDKGGGGNDAGKEKEEKQPKSKKQAKKEAAEKQASKEAAENPAPKAGSIISEAGTHISEARFTMREWRALQEDELFDFQELQLLSHILMRDPNQSWLMVASVFHDKTGRRVHPDDIRDKFRMLDSMGS